jgi:hypothetical protein
MFVKIINVVNSNNNNSNNNNVLEQMMYIGLCVSIPLNSQALSTGKRNFHIIRW